MRPRAVSHFEKEHGDFRLMHHAGKKWRGDGSRGERAGGGYGSGATVGTEAVAMAQHLCFVAAPEFPSVFWGTIDLADWHVDAKHRPGLAGVRTDRLENFARGGRGDRLDADDAVFDLGRVGGRSAFEAPDYTVDADGD